MAVDIEAAARMLDTHAANLEHKAVSEFESVADQLVASAQQVADQIMAEARAKAEQVMKDARAKAAEQTAKAAPLREEAVYWRELAARERASSPTMTQPDGVRPDRRPVTEVIP